jgi:hypothetical protein
MILLGVVIRRRRFALWTFRATFFYVIPATQPDFGASYYFRLNRSHVIPDARFARDRESKAKPAFLDRRWIPGQAFGLPGMTGQANSSTGEAGLAHICHRTRGCRLRRLLASDEEAIRQMYFCNSATPSCARRRRGN